ncbi:MAG: response regulator [Myxococcales bacterium]|nr:response regulator [Myxococcales bacterium]
MSTNIKLLLIEDNQDLREIIEEFLEAYGFIVLPAKDGQEGLDLFERAVPNIVLADVLLPKVNGFQICEKIKKGPRPVPVVLMSALYKTYSMQTEAKTKYGADEYLIKPLNLMNLARLLCRLLGIEKPVRIKEAEPAGEPAPESAAVAADESAANPEAVDPATRTGSLYVLPDAEEEIAISDEEETELDLDRPTFPEAGDLVDWPSPVLIGEIFRRKLTGKLNVTNGSAVRTLYLREGVPVYANSNVAGESFTQLLVADGKVTAEQLGRTERLARERGSTVGKLLVENALIDQADLAAYLLREVDCRAEAVLRLAAGKYSFAEDDSWLEKIKRPEINIFDLTYQVVAKQNSEADLAERYDGRVNQVVFKNEENLLLAGRIQWREEHLDAFILIDGKRTVAEVAAESGQSLPVIHQLLYVLELFDMIRFR